MSASEGQGARRDLPAVAIAIPTRDRHRALAATLEAFEAVDLEGVREILVIDQTDPPFDPSPHAARLPVPVRLVALAEAGLCRARNAALRATAAEIVLYVDDDVVPERGLVQGHRSAYREHPRAVGVAGREELPPGAAPSGFLRRLAVDGLRRLAARRPGSRPFLDAEGRPVGLVTPTGLFLCDFSRRLPCRVHTPRGCNMSFRREALLAVGGFDEGFVGVARREESDASLRLLAARPSSELWFAPEAGLLHLMAPSGGCRDDGGRAWRRQLVTCEMRFARRHLGRFARVLVALRLVARSPGAFLRDPGLWRLLWRPPPAEAAQARST